VVILPKERHPLSEFKNVWHKYSHDEKMTEIVKKLSPARFPLPGPHYDYVDLIEHIRYAIYYTCSCNPDELLEYHLPEIYKRFEKLSSEISNGSKAGFISETEYNYAFKYLTHLKKDFIRDWKECFKWCVIQK